MTSLDRLMLVVFELDEDSPTVAWQAQLARALAARCAHLVILTAKQGRFAPPPNTRILKIPYWAQSWLRPLKAKWILAPFYAACALFGKVDCVFVHMHAEWTYRLAPFLRPWGIPIVTWYAHGSTSWRLNLVKLAANRLLTSSPEGFRLESTKLRIIGQGVDTQTFSIIPHEARRSADSIFVTGRLAPRKRCHIAIEVLALLHQQGHKRLRLVFIGTTVAKADESYRRSLLELIEARQLTHAIEFAGYLPAAAIHQRYSQAILHLNVSETGSMDKTLLEALACGIPSLTTNVAFHDLLKPFPTFFSESSLPQDLANRILSIINSQMVPQPTELHGLIAGRHDFESYVNRVEHELLDSLRE
jgi:glycosyltransferase involved in cell wall biosynthesis